MAVENPSCNAAVGECTAKDCNCKNYEPKTNVHPAPCKNCGHGAAEHGL